MVSAALVSARAGQRARLVRLIHVARRDLGMADDTYRRLVAQYANGKSSSSECSVPELNRIFDHMKRAGFKVRKPKTVKPVERRPLATDPEATKLRAIWLLLHAIGATRSNSEAALAAYVKRMTGVDDLHFTRGADKYHAIEGLKAWAARELPAAINARIGELVAVGTLPTGLHVTDIQRVVAPTLGPRTFDSLWAVWRWLEAKQQKGAEVFDISPAARAGGRS
ncbi:gp16 family protein [Thauera sp.]|uniref:gp16 family protein n=1 Tax=Thauera sp. TaxID=1905334 RepID=UPI0039E23109